MTGLKSVVDDPSQRQLINAGLWNIYLEMRGVQTMKFNIKEKSRLERAKLELLCEWEISEDNRQQD